MERKSFDELPEVVRTKIEAVRKLGTLGPGCCIDRAKIFGNYETEIDTSNVGDADDCQALADEFHGNVVSYTPGVDCH